MNVLDTHEWDHEEERPGYRRRGVALGPRLGASKLGMSLYELPPGESSFPYHYELGCEEWLIVVAGTPTLRDPDGERVLEPGDVVCFPEGPAGAHALANRAGEPARVLLVSNKPPLAVARYPDSGKLLVWSREHGRTLVGDRPELDYWDGEGSETS